MVLGLILGPATYFRSSTHSRSAVVSYWRKYVHEVLVNHLGLSLSRKSVVRLTDRPDITTVRKFTGTDRNGPNYRNGLLLFLLPAQFLVISIQYTCTD